MRPSLQEETRRLRYMWDKHPSSSLAAYLKKDLNEPRTFYTRKILLHYFSEVNPFLGLFFENHMFVPFCRYYLALKAKTRKNKLVSGLFHAVASFSGLVTTLFKKRRIKKSSFLDIACGAGNYYRFLRDMRLDPYITYTGIDLSVKNIAIATKVFNSERENARFVQGNVLDLPFESNSFDIVFVSDLFEHLSLEALSVALKETIRVAKGYIILNFFYESDIPDHVVNPLENYHWNQLSRNKILEELAKNGISRECVEIIDSYHPFGKGKPIQGKNRFNEMQISLSTMCIIKREP